MNCLVIGGSASGKSEYAEALAASFPVPRIYIATMRPWDEECLRRIEKHRLQRADKGFDTIECYDDLSSLTLPPHATVLLECMGNLTANVLFAPQPYDQPLQAICHGLDRLSQLAEHLIVVTNDVFADGSPENADTLRYLEIMAAANGHMAAKFDTVTEVVCGIALAVKGAVL